MLWGIPRDPDIVAALQELEEEENEMGADDEKPKVHCVGYSYLWIVVWGEGERERERERRREREREGKGEGESIEEEEERKGGRMGE